MTESYPSLFPDSKSINKFHVYFQPAENVKMVYPAIVYHRDRMDNKRANNLSYVRTKRYLITVIDRNPDSPIPDNVLSLPLTGYLGFNTKDGLNHDTFSIYY